MSTWYFPGARWWMFDFHTHTPDSSDFKKPQDQDTYTERDWLREFMRRDIDCVAITDHNSGAWVDPLKRALAELKKEKPEWYRSLHLFPGVEISAQGGVHILAIFDPDKETADIDSLLGAVGYQGTKGDSDGVTEKSITEIVDAIAAADGIAIPAHVDREKGLFHTTQGNSLKAVLKNQNIYAMELCGRDFSKPELYESTKTDWTEVCGSDFHGRQDNRFTWIKMGAPSIEGLRLALMDGSTSVNPDMTAEPNRHTEYAIEEITIGQAKYIGRPQELICQFSPFLNTVIGGRGSGKSTLLEFMRLVLRREQELPVQLKEDYREYFRTDESGLLNEDSTLRLVYRKEDTRYRLNWSVNSDTASLEVEDEATGEWRETEGKIASLFPVSIYSQKQIFALAGEPQGLLGIIDREAVVGREEYEKALQDCKNDCNQLYQQRVQLQQKITEEGTLKGKLEEITRKIERLEKTGHKAALQNYRIRRKQLDEIQYVEKHWTEYLEGLHRNLVAMETAEIDESSFAQHPQILTALQSKQQQWKRQIEQIRENIEKQRDDLSQWRQEMATQEWMQSLNQDMQQYKSLRTQLEQQGIDPQTYPNLLQQRALLEKEIQQITGYRKQAESLKEKYEQKLAETRQHREGLTERRKAFLQQALQGNQSVQIMIETFAEPWPERENAIRDILQTGDRFDKDIEALKDKGWEQAKERLLAIRNGSQSARDERFQRHLAKLPNESFIDLRLWFPEDALNITYGKSRTAIHRGSPGQKSAALLAFILAHGNEPLLLDQPEDDLDNNLIYSLIVQEIRENKKKRQIIVVTHNANIVVNGDSEMVHHLNVAGGQSKMISDSLQSRDIRGRICNTMEGGSKAFEQRYKRIHLEN